MPLHQNRRAFVRRTVPALLLLATLAAGVGADEERHRLPDIGDPSYSTLSPADEKKLGKVILAQLRSRLPVITDIEIQSYLQSLGNRLLAQSSHNRLNFHFLPIGDPAINAFATPGGVVAVNLGLMLLTKNESELAAVVAHEIAHVTRRHIARLYAETRHTNWLSALGLIASLIAATYNPALGRLGLAASTTLPIEQRLSYTRSFEQESDRFGIQMMAGAGFNPRGMARFFERLHAKESGRRVPEFLRTHPLTVARLQEARTRAERYPADLREDSNKFRYAKARLEALSGLADAPGGKNPADPLSLYRKGISLTRRHLSYEAIQTLNRIPEAERNIPVSLALAEAYIAQGNYRKAEAPLTAINRLHPGRASVNYHLANCLLHIGQADKALGYLEQVKQLGTYHPELYKLSAELADAAGRGALSHEYLADYYAANGGLNAALAQLDLAMKNAGTSKVTRARIEFRRQEITRLQEEMRRQR